MQDFYKTIKGSLSKKILAIGRVILYVLNYMDTSYYTVWVSPLSIVPIVMSHSVVRTPWKLIYLTHIPIAELMS